MRDVGISCSPPLISVILRKSPYKTSLRFLFALLQMGGVPLRPCCRFAPRPLRCKKKHILPPQAATSSVFICFADYAVTSAASLFFCPKFGQKKWGGRPAVALRAMAGQAGLESGFISHYKKGHPASFHYAAASTRGRSPK